MRDKGTKRKECEIKEERRETRFRKEIEGGRRREKGNESEERSERERRVRD